MSTDEREPLVSVIMPAYNPGRFLQSAVESVLTQTHRALELIVVDDGSTDGSIALIEQIADPRVRLIRQANAGKPAAMNRALALARGEFYALQDADDWSHPERLARQVASLQANPQIAGVFCGHAIILNDRSIAPTFRGKSSVECARDIAHGHMPAHDPTAMYRMSLVRDVRYAEDLPIVEGHDYILRVGERHPLTVLGECLYGYRIHPASVTKKDPERRNRLSRAVTERMYLRRGQPVPDISLSEDRQRSRAVDADNDLVSHFTMSVADQVTAGHRFGAIRTGLVSWRLHPLSAYYAKPFVYALMPRWTVAQYRSMRERKKSEVAEAQP